MSRPIVPAFLGRCEHGARREGVGFSELGVVDADGENVEGLVFAERRSDGAT